MTQTTNKEINMTQAAKRSDDQDPDAVCNCCGEPMGNDPAEYCDGCLDDQDAFERSADPAGGDQS